MTNSAQLFLISSGTSWYHFSASPFNNPWKIRLFAPGSSWLAVAIDSNSQYQSSTSCFPSPRNRLYLNRVEGTIGLSKDSLSSDSSPDPSTPQGVTDPVLSSGPELVGDGSSTDITMTSPSNLAVVRLRSFHVVSGGYGTLASPLFLSSQEDLLGPVPCWDPLTLVTSTLLNKIRLATVNTSRSRVSLPSTALESPATAPKTCGDTKTPKSPDWRV